MELNMKIFIYIRYFIIYLKCKRSLFFIKYSLYAKPVRSRARAPIFGGAARKEGKK